MNMKGKRKIGRKILAFVLSVCMLFTVQPNLWDGIMVQAAEKVENDTESGIMTADDSGQHTNHTGWIALKTDNENATQLSSGNYYLEKSVNMGTITIAENANVTLCLNGKTLKHIGESGSVIVVGENAKFTLCDCQDHWDYISSFDESSKTYSCRVTGQGGCIIGGNGNDFQGGGVYVSSDATFNMNSGRITECDVGRGDKHYGGGVYIKSGTFNMSGGVIDNNSANAGGGVYLEKNCTFEMGQEAVIMCNTAYGTSGGVACSGEFNMRGGKVLGNRADEVGGVTIGGSAFIENGVIEGNISEANISEDSVFAAGLQIQIRGNVKISGGTIRYNIGNSTSDMGCAGVKPGFPMSKLQMSGHVEIYDNYNNGTENNLFLINNKTFSIIGDLSGTIGITSATKPATGSPVIVANGDGHDIQPEDWYCITSDEEYKVTYKDTGENSGNQILLEKLGDCDLSGLILTAEGAKLEPNFQADITTYEATVGNDVEKVGITATLASSTEERTVKIKNGTVLSETEMTSGEKKDVPLAVGSNKIEITVTSGSGSDTKTKTYTLNITRKASDVPAEYKVTLNGNDGTGTDLKSYTYGIGAKLPADWTKTGYDFAGWYEDESCEGTAVTEISATTTGDKEYWAKWTAKTYTVAYSSNGGTIADENNFKEYTYGMGLTLPTPAKTGYTFDGWYEQSDFSGSKVTSISTTDTGAKTYYAKWTLSSYTISYNLDGGTAAGNPTTYTVESSTITLNNPTKEGYTFTGWSGTGLTGEQNTAVTIPKGSTENREYTAHWTAAGYKVTLEGKGGTGGTSLSTYTHGTKVELPTDWMKNGYTFAGWYEDESCEGTAVTEIPANATGDKKYWAGWTANSYTISYNLDGGMATGNPTTYTVENNAITLVNPTKEGYTFTGWSGTGLTGEQNTTVTISKGSTGHRTYTAHWKLADYTVTLHPNGGTGGTDLTAYTYGSVTTLPTNWTKKGYVFDGWYVNENFTGTAVTNISGTDTGNKEYWAKWTDNIAPVIGTLNFNYQPKNFWQWLIGKDSLVITVPVTEEGSGADKITYTETPDGGTVSTKTANIQNGRAEITVSADFKGTISIACTDKANNTSASVTVGAGVAPNGIIIEDNAPKIAFQAENAERLPSGEYKTVPNITVTVADDKNNVISGGIASVSYKIGNGSVKTVDHNYTADMVLHDSFTIPASEISAGETKITVTATDNAGNSVTQNYIVKVHTHSGTLVPAVEPTCTTAGNKEYYTCTCGKWFSDSGCKNEITDHTEVITKALGHDFTGKYQFDTEEHWMKCSRCAATDSREAHSFGEGSNHCTKCEFEKAGEGHTHTGELHERVEPTCTTKGNTAYYTCNCGKWFSDSSCTEEITDKSKIEIAALEHDFVMKHDQNEHWQQCSRCSLEQSRGLHEYDDDSDTDCNVCGYVRTIQHTHSGTLVPAVEPTCTEDGHEAYYTCSCGKWFSDSGCVNEITDHASITVEKRGHDFSGGYQSDENGHWKVCARCNMAQAAESHVFDDEYDTDCNQCGYRRNIENQGNISKDVEKDEKAPDTVLSDSAEELGDIILTEEEKGQIGTGTDIKFILNVKDAGDTVSSGDKTAVQQALDGNTVVKGFSVGQYLDISLFKVIGDTRSAISQTARKLTIVINVPESLKSKDSAKSRTYAIIRVHDGVAEVLADLDGDTDTVTIATDRFSAYALVYKEAGSGADVTPTPTPGGGDQPTPTPGGSDEPSPTPGGSDEPTPTPGGSDKPSPTPGGKDNITPAPSPSEKPEKVSGKEKRKIEIHSGLKAIQTGKKLQISWGRVTGADGYSVYVQYCGKDFSAKSLNQVKSGKKTKITVKKVNGKKLDTAKNFKLYVVAWKWKNGKKSTLTKTLTIHVAGKDSVKYTNVKSIQTGKSSYTLKKGGTVTLHPKAVLYDKHKKQLSAAHCKEFRYLSSNKKVATVTAGGKVKAKGTGECTIYVFAKNGCRRKIKIKVKK